VRVFLFLLPWLANRFCSIPVRLTRSRKYSCNSPAILPLAAPPCLRESRRAFGWLFNRSVESLGNRAIDGEAGASKCLSTGAGVRLSCTKEESETLRAPDRGNRYQWRPWSIQTTARPKPDCKSERDCRDSPSTLFGRAPSFKSADSPCRCGLLQPSPRLSQ